ncbi:MAG: hypothetical protein Q4B70_10150 [Lachnospiraceae bacterium]|nr:hypothetical protein [Lachnospiraceae bacterium]
MKLKPYFKTDVKISVVELSSKDRENTGFKQVLRDENGRIIDGRNLSRGKPQWFKDISQSTNKFLRDADSIEVWIAEEGNPRGIIVPIKNGKSMGYYDTFGNISDKTIDAANFVKRSGFRGL